MKLGYIGYGEAAYAMSLGLAEAGVAEQYACSRTFSYAGKPEEAGVKRCASYQELAAICDMIFVMTPNTAAFSVAQKIAPWLRKGTVYVDLTSSSPGLMRQVAAVVGASGALFVDAAMLDSLPKYRSRVRIVVSGEGAEEFCKRVDGLEMRVENVGEKPGAASAIKLLRSLYTKAHLALAFEMLRGAAYYGAEDYVMNSLAQTMDSKDFITGMNERICSGLIHAARRADELEMAAGMLGDAGLSNGIAAAASEELREIGRLGLKEKLGDRYPRTWKEALACLDR